MKAKLSGPTAAVTAIDVAPVRPAVTAPADRDETTIARAVIVAAHPVRAAARHGPKASAAGPSAARDQVSAPVTPATGDRRRRRCRKLTSVCVPKKGALNPWRARSR
jgi:hypothetical protein